MALWLLSILSFMALSCQSFKDPERACEAFLSAVHERDAAAVFDALLLTTQWSFHSVAKEQRKMRTLIETSYPREEQAPALARLLPEASDGQDLFRQLYPRRYAEAFQRRLGQGPVSLRVTDAAAATCAREHGEPFPLARTSNGRWGMAELNAEWDLAQLRAIHDLDTVRENARLYMTVKGQPKGAQRP